MEKDNQKPQDERYGSETVGQKERTILTKDEVVQTVRDFVVAWIKGDVIITFPNAAFYMNKAQISKERLTPDLAIEKEIANKKLFTERILVITGKTPSTAEELDTTIFKVFQTILAFRCGGRIKGSFAKTENFQGRIDKIEEQISAMNETIQELIIYYRSLVKRD